MFSVEQWEIFRWRPLRFCFGKSSAGFLLGRSEAGAMAKASLDRYSSRFRSVITVGFGGSSAGGVLNSNRRPSGSRTKRLRPP